MPVIDQAAIAEAIRGHWRKFFAAAAARSRVSAIAEAIRGHWRKALRYCAVSAVNVVLGLSTLAFALEVLDLPPLIANLTAWMIGAVPAYLLSRYWVWQQLGANSVKSEILPFWIIALAGLLLSSAAIGVLGTITDNTPILLLGTVIAYGFVWVAKYLVLDGLLWPTDEETVVEVV